MVGVGRCTVKKLHVASSEVVPNGEKKYLSIKVDDFLCNK